MRLAIEDRLLIPKRRKVGPPPTPVVERFWTDTAKVKQPARKLNSEAAEQPTSHIDDQAKKEARVAQAVRDLRVEADKMNVYAAELYEQSRIMLEKATEVADRIGPIENEAHKMRKLADQARFSAKETLKRASELDPLCEVHRPARAILQEVAMHYGLTIAVMRGTRLQHKFTFPRHVAMWRIRRETTKSFSEIGDIMGGRDHTTVIYACEKIDRYIREDGSRIPKEWGGRG